MKINLRWESVTVRVLLYALILFLLLASDVELATFTYQGF